MPVQRITSFNLAQSSQDVTSPVEKQNLKERRLFSAGGWWLEVLLRIMQKTSYVHPYLVKQCLHMICACICVWVGTGRGSFSPPPFFLFSAGKSWMPSLFTEFSFGVVRMLLHTTDSLMFLKLTKLLYASFCLLVPYTLTSSS